MDGGMLLKAMQEASFAGSNCHQFLHHINSCKVDPRAQCVEYKRLYM
jgi:hypothetical protein